MKLTGKIIGANIGFATGKGQLTLEINELSEFKQLYDDLNQKDKLSIEIKEYRKRRSLDANAYFWVLCDKLSEKQGVPKEEIYRSYIKQIGGNCDTVCIKDKAVEKLCEGWVRNGIGWLAETFPSKLEGCTNVTLYYGSSTYDSQQMTRLLDLIIQDCKAVEIPTETPNQIAEMLARWKE
jgi:hypothetical protein